MISPLIRSRIIRGQILTMNSAIRRLEDYKTALWSHGSGERNKSDTFEISVTFQN